MAFIARIFIHLQKNKTSTVIVSEEFLGADDKVLIIDDFLANGDASLGLNDIVKQANATTVGVGIVVEKKFPKWSPTFRRCRLICIFTL